MIIGILGGIGAGKSTVVQMLEQLGAQTVDADALSHEALELPVVRSELSAWLGEGVFDASGRVDRRALGRHVFGAPQALQKLEDLVHPHVRRRIEEKLDAFLRQRRAGREAGLLVLDVPLLASTPLCRRCDALVFVDADQATRRERVRRTRGWSGEELERREQHQLPVKEKRRMADYIIDNSRDAGATREQVEVLLEQLRHRKESFPAEPSGGPGRRWAEAVDTSAEEERKEQGGT